MIREALADAGLTLGRRRRRRSSTTPSAGPRQPRAGRAPRHHAPLDRHHPDRWLQLRDPRPARGGRHRPRACARWSSWSTRPRPARTSSGAPAGGGAGPARPGPRPTCRVGDALRPADADGCLRPRRQPPHARVRHDQRAAGPDRRGDPGVGDDEPPGPAPGPHHRRRRAGLADGGLAAAQARLLPRHRRRRGRRAHLDRAGPRPGQAAGARARCRHLPHPLDDQPDARPHHHRRGRSRAARRSASPG